MLRLEELGSQSFEHTSKNTGRADSNIDVRLVDASRCPVEQCVMPNA